MTPAREEIETVGQLFAGMHLRRMDAKTRRAICDVTERMEGVGETLSALWGWTPHFWMMQVNDAMAYVGAVPAETTNNRPRKDWTVSFIDAFAGGVERSLAKEALALRRALESK